VKFIDIKPKEPPPPEPEKPPPPPEVVAAPPPPKGFQVLAAPIKIPDKLPDIDLSKKVTDEADFSGKGVAGGTHNGVAGGTPSSDQTYFSFQVEKQVLPRSDNPKPKYPSILESTGQSGEVLIQFVVDTTGKIDMNTVKVLKASNDLFASAVKAVLPQWRFLPAEAGGRKVKQLAQLPLTFQPPK
jgi:protein TonB